MPPRFFIDSALTADAVLDLPDAVVRHIQVLRLAPGDAITLFDGRGGSHAATLADLGKRHATAQVAGHDPAEAELPYRVTLAQGLAGGDKMDWLIEKPSNSALPRSSPCRLRVSVVRLSATAPRAARRTGRPLCRPRASNADGTACRTWRRWLPWKRGWRHRPNRLEVRRGCCSPRASASLPELAAAHRDAWREQGVTLVIGPEGGLSPEEEAAAIRAGFTGVSLGPRILRTETAGLTCLAALNAVLGGF